LHPARKGDLVEVIVDISTGMEGFEVEATRPADLLVIAWGLGVVCCVLVVCGGAA
jgi:hypothetical protein